MIGLLLLYPSEPTFLPEDQDQFVSQLQQMEFLGPAAKWQAGSWHTGDSFLQQISFMGCSPHIRLDPDNPEDRGWSYVTFLFSNETILRSGRNTRPPYCPHCRRRISDYPTDPLLSVVCPHCDATSHLHQLNWKHTAAVARLFVEIHNIFPSEAVPVDAFLKQLSKRFGVDWNYCYLLP